MIWQRTVACQMTPAKFDQTTVDIAMGEGVSASPAKCRPLPAFSSVYEEGTDESDEDEDRQKLPEMKEGEVLPVDALYGEQHFTSPPPRYNEATLVKALEEFGIGRPSTYASIISTLKDREYVTLEQKRFMPPTPAILSTNSSPSISPNTSITISPPSSKTSWTTLPAASVNGCR